MNIASKFLCTYNQCKITYNDYRLKKALQRILAETEKRILANDIKMQAIKDEIGKTHYDEAVVDYLEPFTIEVPKK
jgi:hypothetical protein